MHSVYTEEIAFLFHITDRKRAIRCDTVIMSIVFFGGNLTCVANGQWRQTIINTFVHVSPRG